MKTKVKIAFGIVICTAIFMLIWFINYFSKLPIKDTITAFLIVGCIFAITWSAKVLGEYSGSKKNLKLK